jgi:hypothetical protein
MMDLKIIDALRAAVMAAHPGDMPEVLAERDPLLNALRAEEFWNGRAPQMTDELLILRQVEAPARVIAKLDPTHKTAGVLALILGELDALRAKQGAQ